MTEHRRSLVVRAGDRLSEAVARLFAHPVMHVGVLAFCIAWFALRLPTDLLTAALSILAITLTQMVLNGQFDREADTHLRDVAMHAKLDELITATKRARDEMVGIEEQLDEEQIQQLREQAKRLVEAAARGSGEHRDLAAAKRAIERVGDGK